METLIREAESKVVTPNLTEMLYCVEHDRMVKAETFNHGMGHLQIEETLGEAPEVEVCTFPLGYAFVAPPADDGDWASQEPSLEEREQAEIEERLVPAEAEDPRGAVQRGRRGPCHLDASARAGRRGDVALHETF